MCKHKIILGIIFLLLVFTLKAQQDPMFTQYITNPVAINPAITGSNKITTLSAVYREQWMGITGAPSTFVLTFDGVPEYRKIGLGGSLIYDKIGPVVQTGLYINYAYHVKIREDKNLSLGLMGGANYYQFDILSLLVAEPDNDISFVGNDSRLLPNFGFGAFYYTPTYFLGFSVPKLVRNKYYRSESAIQSNNREERHYFVWAGMLIDLNDQFKFKPSLIGRVVNGAPVSLDVNATVVLMDKVWMGVLYRFGVNWGGLVKWQLNNKLNLGYSYDLSSSRTSGYGTGTHEIFISLQLGDERGRILSPRYF